MKSWLEVDGARLRGNLEAVRAAVGPEVEVLAVIKADAYGHGASVCAPVLAAAGARWLGVTDVAEGVAMRAALGDVVPEVAADVRILVMCGFEAGDAAALVGHELTPVVWTPDHLLLLQEAAEAAGTRVRVHVEVDTGMARQGVTPGEAMEVLGRVLRSCSRVVCEGVFSHLGSSEVVSGEKTARQRERFATALAALGSRDGGKAPLLPALLHLENTSGVDEGSTTGWVYAMAGALGAGAMVRPGLALYGYALPLRWEDPAATGETVRRDFGTLGGRIQPVGTWKTRVIGVRIVEAGDAVGYGATFVADGPMRLALLPVGYADGFRREASSGAGGGWVRIAGARAPVVGRVSMNLTVVDVTGMGEVRVGEEVVLLGEGVTAEDHAGWCGTIAYEILCGVRAQAVLV